MKVEILFRNCDDADGTIEYACETYDWSMFKGRIEINTMDDLPGKCYRAIEKALRDDTVG